MKKIAILLPGPRREPVGGYKILYQYGDHLASVGWSVDFIYLTNDIVCNYRFHGLKGRIKANILSCLKYYNWYRFTSKNINHFVKKSFDKKILDHYELIVCSSVETFIYADEIISLNHEKIVYFVQDYENWSVEKSKLDETLSHSDIEYITISNDLADKITHAGGKVSLILHNGINSKDFYNVKLWEQREAASFLFLYHPSERKGCDLLLQVICNINKENKSIIFSCFSAYPKPKHFPVFIKYYYRPSLGELNSIYNDNRFFICSSVYEGFGLTPAEAAFTGGIVLTTKNGGVEQYIEHGITGFILEDRANEVFVQAIKDLVEKGGSLADFSRESSEKIINQLDLEKNFTRLNHFLNNKIAY